MKTLLKVKTLLKAALLATGFAVFLYGTASAQSASSRSSIENLLHTYEAALNASDVDAVMEGYASDPVFMPQHSLPQVGTVSVRDAYVHVFETIDLDIEFEISEILQVAPNWAIARTTSTGFVTINETGAKFPEGNQELFVLHQEKPGDWKIARYIFSTTKPRQQ